MNIENSTLGVLTENNCYFDILLNKREEVQNGLYLINLKLGLILSVRIKEKYFHKSGV